MSRDEVGRGGLARTAAVIIASTGCNKTTQHGQVCRLPFLACLSVTAMGVSLRRGSPARHPSTKAILRYVTSITRDDWIGNVSPN